MPSDFSDKWSSRLISAARTSLTAALLSVSPAAKAQDLSEGMTLAKAAADAEQQLQQSFTNLQFEDFGPAPVKGPLYQASAGGRIVYYAPESEHLLFASIFDKNGVNLTALAQEAGAAKRLKAIDTAVAFAVGCAAEPEHFLRDGNHGAAVIKIHLHAVQRQAFERGVNTRFCFKKS